MTTTNPWDDPRITAYVMGELSGDERVEFETELRSSETLADAVEEARSVAAKLEELFAAESNAALTDARRETIVSGASRSVDAKTKKSTSWKVPMLLLATAATVAILIGVAPMLQKADEQTLTQVEEFKTQATVAYPVEQEESVQTDFAPAVQDHLESELRFDRKLEQKKVISEQTVESVPLKQVAPASGPVAAEPSRPSRRSRRMAMERMDGMMMGMGGMDEDMDMEREMMMEMSDMGMDAQGMQPSKDGSTPSQAYFEFGRESGARVGLDVRFDDSRRGLSTSLSTAGRPVLSKQPNLGLPSLGVDYGLPMDEGRGPGIGGDKFEPITDNAFRRVSEHPLSTFSIDVDTASYSKTRDFLMRANQWPRPDAVRIEELVNYFDYDYEAPADDAPHPFAADVDITSCPWNDQHRLARIAIQGKTMKPDQRPRCNLVFLIDTSGSMNAANKLPLVIDGMKLLLKQLDDKDRVAITVYAGSAGLVLDSTPAKKGKKIRKALTQLQAGGSTNGGAGIQLAYQTARDNFIEGGVNRVILCSDGDFNVGTTGTDSLVRMVQQEAKGGIFLSVLGFGMGNHNDAMLEQISGRGNGNYAFIDTEKEARKVLVDQVSGTLVTIAKDVKLQVDFTPTKVSAYRLIGYENRILAKEDFNDDTKDAGEIGAGHSVTALYEVVPVGVETDVPKVDESKYQSQLELTEAAQDGVTLTVRIRYKQPDGDVSTRVDFPITDGGTDFADASDDTRFVAAVAGFGMQLRGSEHAGTWRLADVLTTAKSAQGDDQNGLRSEFVELVKKAAELKGTP